MFCHYGTFSLNHLGYRSLCRPQCLPRGVTSQLNSAGLGLINNHALFKNRSFHCSILPLPPRVAWTSLTCPKLLPNDTIQLTGRPSCSLDSRLIFYSHLPQCPARRRLV